MFFSLQTGFKAQSLDALLTSSQKISLPEFTVTGKARHLAKRLCTFCQRGIAPVEVSRNQKDCSFVSFGIFLGQLCKEWTWNRHLEMVDTITSDQRHLIVIKKQEE